MSMTKVIIAGSRSFTNFKVMDEQCQSILAMFCAQNGCDITIISGGADGADSLGKEYAYVRQWVYEEYPADWDQYGKAAGPIRNKQMAQDAQILIAFWDGRSPGTLDMIKQALKGGLDLHVLVDY